jgi:hypothetical protein
MTDCADAMPAEASRSAAIAQSGKHRRAMSPSPIRSSATIVYSHSNEIIVERIRRPVIVSIAVGEGQAPHPVGIERGAYGMLQGTGYS